MHQQSVLHRNMKPQNILLTLDGVVKIADFGLAKAIGTPGINRLSEEVVTLWYRAPHVLLGGTDYNDRIDIWSMGCIFVELCVLGRPIFPGTDSKDQLRKIAQIFGIQPNVFFETEKDTMKWPEAKGIGLGRYLESIPCRIFKKIKFLIGQKIKNCLNFGGSKRSQTLWTIHTHCTRRYQSLRSRSSWKHARNW